jgi:hypothetical protein
MDQLFKTLITLLHKWYTKKRETELSQSLYDKQG